jgi:nucleoside-diphosphate-sugar epimerase
MKVFLTGATGFIGSRIVAELVAAGHDVLGLTRSEAGERALISGGANVHRGTLEDLQSLRAGAEQADAVIHTAFDHDFAHFAENCEKDRRAIEALGSVLKDSNHALIITSGTGMGDPGQGQLAREDVFNVDHPNPRIASELAGADLLAQGIDLRVMRLPQVHNPMKQGLISPFIQMSRQNGAAVYVGEGDNRWPAAHVLDVAKLYVLALDRGRRGARYHAVAEEGIAARTIAETVAAGLGVPAISVSPAEATTKLGWFASFASLDMPASSDWTKAELGWKPNRPGLIEDLRSTDYSNSSRTP